MSPPLSICFAASEAAPFAKTGGLADVAAALPRQLRREGHDIRVFLPRYAAIDPARWRLQPVDFARDVAVELGPSRYRFDLYTAPQPDGDLAFYFVDCPALYGRDRLYTGDPDEPERFALFSRAVIESCQRMGWAPDVFHCNDWHTALIPLLLRTVYEWDRLFQAARTVLTVHNIGYQGKFPAEVVKRLGLDAFAHLFDQEELRAGGVNFLRTGLLYANRITTVSPTYAREIQTPEYGMGLHDLLQARRSALSGILNGVDYEHWSPERDSFIPHPYSAARLAGKTRNKGYLLEQLGLDPATDPPLAGIVSRLAHQKGFDLCAEVLPPVLAGTPMRLAVLGTGEARLEAMFGKLQRQFPGKVVYYRGYHEELAHLIEAGADIFLMPSRYEPCGLNQMFSLRYGTIPVVRRTGGLADSVQAYDERTGEGTGFVFEHFTPDGLAWALGYALRTFENRAAWKRLMANAMAQDFSWKRQTGHYVQLYRALRGR